MDIRINVYVNELQVWSPERELELRNSLSIAAQANNGIFSETGPDRAHSSGKWTNINAAVAQHSKFSLSNSISKFTCE